jgi:hypothetical protein
MPFIPRSPGRTIGLAHAADGLDGVFEGCEMELVMDSSVCASTLHGDASPRLLLVARGDPAMFAGFQTVLDDDMPDSVAGCVRRGGFPVGAVTAGLGHVEYFEEGSAHFGCCDLVSFGICC